MQKDYGSGFQKHLQKYEKRRGQAYPSLDVLLVVSWVCAIVEGRISQRLQEPPMVN